MTATTSKTKLVRLLRGGQITIPIEFRRELGLDEEAMFRVTLSEGEIRISPIQFRRSEPSDKRGSPELKALYDYFAPVREEILARGISEEEVNADIEAAIAAVRAEKNANR